MVTVVPLKQMAGVKLVGAALLCIVFAGCGGGKSASSVTSSASPAAPTATPAPAATLTVTPAAATLGGVFTFKAAGFQPGEVVRFSVTRPSGKVFTGPPHTATAAGDATASYKPSESGHFSVTAAGAAGGRATGTFDVGPAPVRQTVTHPAATRAPVPKATVKPAPAPTATPYHY